MIKVLHITAGHLSGGAAKSVVNLNKLLNENGIESFILNNYEKKEVNTINIPKNRFQLLFLKILMKIDIIFTYKYSKRKRLIFSTGRFGISISKYINELKPDIVHLHWINGLLSIKEISKIEVPIVWTVRDTWPMTGGCHLSFVNDCDRFQDECGYCPQLKSNSLNDLSNEVLKSKLLRLNRKNISIVGLSDWICNLARKSALFAENNIQKIPNFVDANDFYPESHNFNHKKYILTGCKYNDEEHKGFDLLTSAVNRLKIKDYKLVIFGEASEKILNKLDIEYVHYKNPSTQLLRRLYSNAQVFISCTKIESFGKVFIESMACGTPNIGFNCTGHAELILDGYNGYKANPYSYKEIADLIQKVLSLNEKEYCELSKNCLEHVKNYYSNCNVFDLHETLYSNLLKK